MKTVTVRELSREGVSKAIRAAQVEPVLVSKNNEPAVWMVSADALAHIAMQHTGDQEIYRSTLQAVAVDLFDHDVLSMGRAAQLAGLPLGDFIDLCDRLHVPVLRESETGVAEEVDAFETWLAAVETPADEEHASHHASR
jgi:PHD/YefM family antitoxin component YafN of YafNO toxin-antitoxin module